MQHCQSIGPEAQACPTEGNPIVIAKTPRPKSTKGRRHFMVYGHYDVQPPEPFDLWKTPPFQPTIRGAHCSRAARVTTKARTSRTSKRWRLYLKTGTELPCDLTFVIEGEEEVGSKKSGGLFAKASRRTEVRCGGHLRYRHSQPQASGADIRAAGIAAFEIILRGPSRDLHSGIFGGSVENPAMALSRLLAKVHDAKGRIVVPHFMMVLCR